MPSKNPVKSLFPTARPKLAAIPGGPRVHAPTDMLGPDHFKIAIVIALVFHAGLFGVWSLLPKQKVVEIPVQTLTLKLGDAVNSVMSDEAVQALAPNGDNLADVEATLAHMVRNPAVDAARADFLAGAMDAAVSGEDVLQKHATLDAIQQFVRTPATQAKESADSASQKDVVMRYETLVTMWLQKFMVYPPEAKDAGDRGKTMLRLQIDRQGNIRNFVLEGSSGSAVLDRAAIDMVRRANPVPAMPNDYPAGELFEFAIPVNFQQ
jgi:TonB family protein